MAGAGWRTAQRAERCAIGGFASLVVLGYGVSYGFHVSRFDPLMALIAGWLLLALVRGRRWAWGVFVAYSGLVGFWLVLAAFGVFFFPEGLVGVGTLVDNLIALALLLSPPMRRYVGGVQPPRRRFANRFARSS